MVLNRAEVAALLDHLSGTMWIIGMLLYGSGLRLLECLTLRVKDLDLERGEIRIRAGKGNKDRNTMIPEAVKAKLRQHLQAVRERHHRDVTTHQAGVVLPGALARKIPAGGAGVGVVLGLPGAAGVLRAGDRQAAPTPLA